MVPTHGQRNPARRLGGSNGLARPRDIMDLNEAYRGLMTPEMRSSYDAGRAAVLGANATPKGPQPERPGLPLRVMETQMPALLKPAYVADEVTGGWSLPVPIQFFAGSVTLFATATFLAVRWLLF